jgi:hypothetical protein
MMEARAAAPYMPHGLDVVDQTSTVRLSGMFCRRAAEPKPEDTGIGFTSAIILEGNFLRSGKKLRGGC